METDGSCWFGRRALHGLCKLEERSRTAKMPRLLFAGNWKKRSGCRSPTSNFITLADFQHQRRMKRTSSSTLRFFISALCMFQFRMRKSRRHFGQAMLRLRRCRLLLSPEVISYRYFKRCSRLLFCHTTPSRLSQNHPKNSHDLGSVLRLRPDGRHQYSGPSSGSRSRGRAKCTSTPQPSRRSLHSSMSSSNTA